MSSLSADGGREGDEGGHQRTITGCLNDSAVLSPLRVNATAASSDPEGPAQDRHVERLML
jgi:hypothetical protein